MLTIKSNGAPEDTEIYLDGYKVNGVNRILLEIKANELSEINLDMFGLENHLLPKEDNLNSNECKLFIRCESPDLSVLEIDSNPIGSIISLSFIATMEKVECSYVGYTKENEGFEEIVIF